MMLKTFLNYLQYSGIWISVALNPFHWALRFDTVQPDDLNPKGHGMTLTIGPLSIKGVIDDGSW